VALLALDASVVLVSRKGEKAVPYAAMVAVQLICLVLIWWRLPDTRAIAAQRAAAAEAADPGEPPAGELKLLSALPIMMSLAAALSSLALAGLWTFAEEMGVTAGLSAQTTASFLGSSQLMGLLGTMAPWLLGPRIGRAALGVASFVLMAAGVFMVGLIHQPTAYIVGNLALNLGYWATMPLMLSVAADLDRNSGRLVAFMLGMSSVGLAIGPSLAGPLLGGTETTLGGWLFGLIALAAAPLIAAPPVAADRAARAALPR
jgi:MFS family permease